MARPECPAENAAAVDTSHGIHWNLQTVGWLIAGLCAVATLVISLVSVFRHCRNYTNPRQQRQILRILYLPPVYGIMSFLSFRFFRSYTYFELVQVIYEAVAISAFILLLIEFVASTVSGHDLDKALARKEKSRLPPPLSFMRYRPTKPSFMYAIKWSVLQYVVMRPVISVVGIICQSFGVLCPTLTRSPYYAYLWLAIIDTICVTIAIYGLLLFYDLTKDELKDKRPLAKFLSIKLIVFLTFVQSFLFSLLKGRVIHATKFWTEDNIADGLTALVTCVEMVAFSGFMMWAYPWSDYVVPGRERTSIWRPLWDSINYTDFVMEILGSLKYYLDSLRGKHEHRLGSGYSEMAMARGRVGDATGNADGRMDFATAFGVYTPRSETERHLRNEGVGSAFGSEETIRLTPYEYREVSVVEDPEVSSEDHHRMERR